MQATYFVGTPQREEGRENITALRVRAPGFLDSKKINELSRREKRGGRRILLVRASSMSRYVWWPQNRRGKFGWDG